MKKITGLLLCAIACTILSSNAQSFTDGGFESWKQWSAKKGDYWDLENNFIVTLNTLYSLEQPLGDAPLIAHREEQDVKSGNYSLKLRSDVMYVGSDPLFLPGAAGTLAIEFFPPGVNLNKPFTFRPTGIKGSLKYIPQNGDSAAIEIILKDVDGDVDDVDAEFVVLGSGKRVYKNATDEWEDFNIGVNYTYQTSPNAITVIFAASANYNFESLETLKDCKGQIGSVLLLDDVALDYGIGIIEMLDPEIQLNVYPNPSTEKITVQMGKETNATIHIYDYLLRKIGEYSINGTQTDIDVQKYTSGSYLINVIENDKIITTGRFVKQ